MEAVRPVAAARDQDCMVEEGTDQDTGQVTSEEHERLVRERVLAAELEVYSETFVIPLSVRGRYGVLNGAVELHGTDRSRGGYIGGIKHSRWPTG